MAAGWFKVDELIDLNPKLLPLGGDECWMYLRGLAHCSRQATDGFIDRRTLKLLGSHVDGDPETCAKALVDAELWVEVDGAGWSVPDWLDWNMSKEEREKASTDGNYGNHKRWHVDRGVSAPDCTFCREGESPPNRGGESGGDRGGESQTRRDETREDKKKSSTRKRAIPLPDSWTPNDAHRELASQEGVDLQREERMFRDHAAANGRTQKDWDAAFRMWLQKAADYGGRRAKPQGQWAGAGGVIG